MSGPDRIQDEDDDMNSISNNTKIVSSSGTDLGALIGRGCRIMVGIGDHTLQIPE